MPEPAREFIGLYSGDALDGVDAAWVTLRGFGGEQTAQLRRHLHKPYPPALRQRVREAAGGACESAADLAALDRDVGILLAEAGEALLTGGRRSRSDVDGAGSSSQRLALSAPTGERTLGGVLEIGSPDILAGRLGLPVVSGFARSDIAAGGVGGPVRAWCAWRMLRDERLSRVLVHLGAVATVVFVPAGPPAGRGAATPGEVVAFDAGPGTALSDALAEEHFGRPCDADGALAAGATVNAPLLNELLAHPYLRREPPKRTTAADWSQAYRTRLAMRAEKHRCGPADLLATVTELAARTVAGAIAALTERPHQVVLAGGGARNIHLAGRIRRLCSPSSTITTDKFGIPPQAHPAVCMAMLAAARMDGAAAHCAAATGAARPRLLGSVTAPA